MEDAIEMDSMHAYYMQVCLDVADTLYSLGVILFCFVCEFIQKPTNRVSRILMFI